MKHFGLAISACLQQQGAPLGSGAEPKGRGSSDTRAEYILHWASAKALEQYSETPEPAPATRHRIIAQPGPTGGGSVPLELCVSLLWRSRTHGLIHHPVLIPGLAGDFRLALPLPKEDVF